MTSGLLKNLRNMFSRSSFKSSEAALNLSADEKENLETPRQVFLATCAEIAKDFEAEGFRYAKSGPHIILVAGDFTFRVSFQSSYRNVSGQHVRLWVHATVSAKCMKEFRRSHLPENLVNDGIAGGMVHRLLPDNVTMVEWDLANPETRAEVIAEVISLIRKHVLPYFALFSKPAELVMQLTKETLPAFDIRHSVEFALCFGDKTSAQKILARFLRDRPDLLPQIESVRHEGLKHPEHGPSNFAETVVYLQREFGLQ